MRVRAAAPLDDAKGQPVISAAFTPLNDANHPAFQFDDALARRADAADPGAARGGPGDYIAPGGRRRDMLAALHLEARVHTACNGY